MRAQRIPWHTYKPAYALLVHAEERVVYVDMEPPIPPYLLWREARRVLRCLLHEADEEAGIAAAASADGHGRRGQRGRGDVIQPGQERASQLAVDA